MRYFPMLYVMLFLFAFSCQKKERMEPFFEDIISDYRTDNAIQMEVSSDSIQLNAGKKDDQALLVTWEPVKKIDSLFADSIKYSIKMDLAENEFTTATENEIMNKGDNFRVFTNRELDDLLRNKWQIESNEYTSLSIRVIATVYSEEKYIKPLYSTKTIKVRPFNISSHPVFLYGDAFQGGGTQTTKIGMTENVEGELYSWRGRLYPGSFKLANQLESDFPGFGKGNNGEVVPIDADSDNDGFEIEEEGYYAVTVNLLNKTINVEPVLFETVYLGGSATEVGWSSPLITMDWDVNKPQIWTVNSVDIGTGELKFSAVQGFSQANGDIQIRPRKPDASIIDDLDVSVSVLPDWKWKVESSETGKYDIVLDLKAMTVQFNKR